MKEELKEDLNELINDSNGGDEEEQDLEIKNKSPVNGSFLIYKKLLEKLQNTENQNTLDSSNNEKKTLIVFHNSSLKHGEIKEENMVLRIKRREMQVENPDRLNVLLKPKTGVLHSDFFKQRFIFKESASPATLADILRVHDFNYIDSVRKMCEDMKATNKTSTYKYDSDTYINQHTYESAVHAAGCVVDAVDSVMKGEFKNAICLVRPPGHHAGYYGKVE